MTPAIIMQRLYLVQLVGSGKVPSNSHWKGGMVVDTGWVVEVSVVSGMVAISVVVGRNVVDGSVAGHVPMTHPGIVPSK